MRIAFAYAFDDTNWLGGRNYYSGLFSAIRSVAADSIQPVLVTGTTTRTTLPSQFPEIEVVRTRLLDRRSFPWALRQIPRMLSQWTTDPAFESLLRRHAIDLLSHAWGLGSRSSVKSLGWVPDFQFMHFPQFWTPKQLRGTHRLNESICRSSSAIVLSSESARSDLRTFAPWCEQPTHILHFVPLPIAIDSLPPAARVLDQYRLPRIYFHLPNQFWAHKNHRVVVDALSIAKRRGIDMTVTCTGQTADMRQPGFFDELMAHCREVGVEDRFRILGTVPYSDMQALMRHAHAVINPSLFEGWSTTVEEAKLLGKRVLLSDIPVHREQAPHGGQYFDPKDPEELATAMAESLASPWREPDAAQVASAHLRNLDAFGRTYIDIVRNVVTR